MTPAHNGTDLFYVGLLAGILATSPFAFVLGLLYGGRGRK